MYDLISRKELFERFQKQAMTLYGKDSERYQMVMDIMDGVRFAPAVDAEPVVHGRWIPENETWGRMICSECKVEASIDAEDAGLYNLSNYCPNCGAKMDEVSE